MKISSAGSIIGKLVDTISKDGFYLLNISPKADGTIPENQQQVLLAIGDWLHRNGEAIYGTHAWKQFGDGDWRFTVKQGVLYAIGKASGEPATLASLTPAVGKVTRSNRSAPGRLPSPRTLAAYPPVSE
jgi:alpha-L-fucosidase